MLRAIIYTRVSTDEQARNNLSLSGQEKEIHKYCERETIHVEKQFTDSGESAKTADRPALIDALEYCRQNSGKIDYFIVWKIDRLSRQVQDYHAIKAALLSSGVQIRSATEVIGESSTEKLMESVLASFAQFDNDVRAERSLKGVMRRLEQGGWPHLAPLGYSNAKNSEGIPTIVKDLQAPLVAKWLSEYLRGGYSRKQMHELASDMGIVSRQDKKISYAQVCLMLRNPIYAGIIQSQLLPSPIHGIHEPLITVEDHESILRKLGDRGKPNHAFRPSDMWPLRNGIVRCLECGSALTGSASKGRSKYYALYRCSGCRVSEVKHRVSVSREELHEQFEEHLRRVTPTDEMLTLFRETFIKKWHTLNKDQRVRQNELQELLNTLLERKERVVSAFISNELTFEEKQQQTSKIDTELVKIRLQLNEVREEAMDVEGMVDYSIAIIQDTPKLWRTASMTDKHRLQDMLFPKGLSYSFVEGFGTAEMAELYGVIEEVSTENANLVGIYGSIWNQLSPTS